MILFPAIDLKDGKVVRLHQGDYHQITQYYEKPLQHASHWAEQGIKWLHIVDLDAAKSGEAKHKDIIVAIATSTGLQVQVGGGIRSLEMAEYYLEHGVARVVVGTKAVQDPAFLAELAQHYPKQIALGLDTRDGMIATHGWTESSELSVKQYLEEAPLNDIACIIFTEISRDGTLAGPNIEALHSVLELSPIPVIASGGISQLEDLRSLKNLNHPQLLGVIVGKALYEGRFSISEALESLK